MAKKIRKNISGSKKNPTPKSNSDKKVNKAEPTKDKKVHKAEELKSDDFEEKLEKIRTDLKENYIQQKKLMNELKELLSIHKKDIKLISKNGNRTNCGKNSGFNKPEAIPPSLKKLLKINEDMLPRSKVTRLMYQYFTDNKMYSTKTKKEIIPNSKIKEIFGMKDGGEPIHFYNLQTWLKKVYDENANKDKKLEIDS